VQQNHVKKQSENRLALTVEWCKIKRSAESKSLRLAGSGNISGLPDDAKQSGTIIKHEKPRCVPKLPSIKKVKALLAERPSAIYDEVDVSILFRDTWSELERYENLVREGIDLDSALAFCRYVEGAGLLRLFKANEGARIPVVVDSKAIADKSEALRWRVRDMWTKSGSGPLKVNYAPKQSQIESINQKLDIILAMANGTASAAAVAHVVDVQPLAIQDAPK